MDNTPIDRAKDLMKNHQFEEASKIILELCETETNDKEAWAARSQLFLLQMENDYNKLDYRELYIHSVFVDFEKKVQSLLEKGNYSKAGRFIDLALKGCPDHPGVFYLKGSLYLTMGEFVRAKQYFEQTVFYDANQAKYWLSLGKACNHTNDYARAREAMEHANLIEPNCETTIELGYCFLHQGKFLDASKYAEIACQMNKDSFEAIRLLGRCYSERGEVPPEKILDILEKARKLGKDKDLDFDIARVLYLCGYYDRCIKQCKMIIIKNPNEENAQKARQLISRVSEQTTEKSRAAEKVQNRDDSNIQRETKNLGEAIQRLDSLIGLDSVKHEIHAIIRYIDHERKRREVLGIPSVTGLTNHFMFTGNPGTGKTSVARLLGDIFYHLGILKKGHLVETDRSSLVGQYIGATAIMTREKVDEAMDGILFVDEAYALARSDTPNDFGREAVEVILKAMEDHRDRLIVILAGYPKEMGELIKLNPGLASRINRKIHFPDYDEDALLEIARGIAGQHYYELPPESEAAFLRNIWKENVDESFANARTVRNIIEEAIKEKAYRLGGTSTSREELCTLKPIDFGFTENESQQEVIHDSLSELDQLVGMQEVKTQVVEIKNYVLMETKRKEMGLPTKPLVLHMQFIGNPGTGKTTVARIVGRILQSIGILKRGHMIEVSRADLVGGYVGQTATKTINKVKEAYGGILFIDEAYSLYSPSESDFGHEAISSLIKEMEDNKEKLVVIMAGYPMEMQQLLNMNPGLHDRIRFKINFPDYTADELLEIFTRLCTKHYYKTGLDTNGLIKLHFTGLIQAKTKNFGNGRLVEKFFEAVIRNQANRAYHLSGDDLVTIIPEDVRAAMLQ